MAAPARGRAELSDTELDATYEGAWIEPGARQPVAGAHVAALRAVADAAVARFVDESGWTGEPVAAKLNVPSPERHP